MNITMPSRGTPLLLWTLRLCLIVLTGSLALSCNAQDETEQASISSSIGSDGTGKIVVEARGTIPKPAVLHRCSAKAKASVGAQRVEQTVELVANVIQGDAEILSVGIAGEGRVTEVTSENLKGWSVRREGESRFLDLHVKEGVTDVKAVISLRSAETPYRLPTEIELTHLTPGESVGFDSTITVEYAPEVDGKVISASGFAPLDSDDRVNRFQTATGGTLKLALNRSGLASDPVELTETTLQGELHPNGDSVRFRLSTTATVSEPDSEVTILSGNAAAIGVPTETDYRLRLASEGDRAVYKLAFPKPGSFSVELDFVASLKTTSAQGRSLDFTIAAGAVVPLTVTGLDSDLEFHRDQESVVPLRDNENWVGFLPATGRAKLSWKTARKAGEGKLFFTTAGHIESTVGAGLMRQEHQIDYQILQGELKSLEIVLQGPGEILDVQGTNIVGWKVVDSGDDRRLEVTLSQPITGQSQIKVRSQTPLDAFPVRVEGLRLNPVGAIRHSGFLRLTNSGSVRLEPTGLSGLTQLAPEQFPGKRAEARQVFVYRFPAADHAFTVAADRIQPEVNVSELVLYQLAETDRVIRADIELDIREAPIREWDFGIPSDYSVVAVTGANVADYIAASAVTANRRNLKVIFGQDVGGRQLVSLQLEKSEVAAAGDWQLPRIEYPEAKTVRGDIGVIGAPGFRIAVGQVDLLVEKPLSYFPKPSKHLQQAFRIRQPGWSATMQIELLDRSVQSDVFHLYSLSQETVYGSALINYFVTGAPVSEWKIAVPQELGNVMVDGQDVRTWRREGDTLIVSLHQGVMGAYTLLVTFEEKPDEGNSTFQAGQIAPIDVQGERGFIQVVSPMQVEMETVSISDDMLKLDALELPAEFRLLSSAPPLGTWQYTDRPFDLNLKVNWFEPGTTVTQVVEFSEANSRVSKDGELVTDVLYYIKSRGRRTFKIRLPDDPVRLWAVSVNGQPVTARQTDEATLIPLPGGTDPNIPVEVSLRLGKPAVSASNPQLTLPLAFAPVLKTQWNIVEDENRVLVPVGGTVKPDVPVLRPSGFEWIAKNGIASLAVVAVALLIGILAWLKTGALRLLGLVGLATAIIVCFVATMAAINDIAPLEPLQLSLPVLAEGELVELSVSNLPLWSANLSWVGLLTVLCGALVVAWSFRKNAQRRGDRRKREWIRMAGVFLISLGVLWQGDGAPWFFGILAVGIFVALFLRPAIQAIGEFQTRIAELAEKSKTSEESPPDTPGNDSGAVTATLAFLAFTISMACSGFAAAPAGFESADSIEQQWKISRTDARLSVTASGMITGRPGDRFLLLKAPAVLTKFDGNGLRLSKSELAEEGLSYVVTIPSPEKAAGSDEEEETEDSGEPEEQTDAKKYRVLFAYQLESIQLENLPVLTGIAAIQKIKLEYDEPGWDVNGPSAVQIEEVSANEESSVFDVLLGPGKATLSLRPKARDVSSEETQFFVEASNLFLPGPGVVDGRHRLNIRTSQGQVNELSVLVPKGLTVSAVSGPIGSWQFDADSGALKLEVEPAQSQSFDVMIETQRSLDPLPADVILAPLTVTESSGQVGLVAIAFGPDAQPESLDATGMSTVNLGDFDAGLLSKKNAVLHRVYRYGAEGGELAVRVAPVAPEVRVLSKQVLSLGDERVVLGINFNAEITRAGLFQLSFPLPNGLEVESLTGASLHHWAELSEDGGRQIILHLNGKTIGTQSFSLTLSGASPTETAQWDLPRFELNEASRQTGELVVRPTAGIRLRTITRQNVSETDPRTMGGKGQGALAFRLLQRDWNLVLGIEKLDPWVIGQLLHEITLREGQTRTALIANFDVQNASIRALRVSLPITDADEIKTLRAMGNSVSDFVRTALDSDIWEIQFKRRIIGKVDFRIEYERRGDRDDESLSPAGFPQARQLAYFFAVRAGGRLELQHDPLTDGWQRVEWNTIPQSLRNAENQSAPSLAFRAVKPSGALTVQTQRHSLADALKLRVASGNLTTVLSPTGDQLTAVDVTMDVIQRSSLSVGLPSGGELFSIFVNGESVNSIRRGGNSNAWQFYILPGIDDRTANVRFVYTVKGNRLSSLVLTSPELNVPLENIQWNVIAPKGFELVDNDGNLELAGQTNQDQYDRASYLSKVSGKRQVQAQQAAQLLEQANELLQAGQQSKASWALKSVANQYALDAASNEDARVQLENLQTQQAIVGLNTRRQRIYLDNSSGDSALVDNEQLRQAATANPVLQQNQLNFRPQQLSQLLRGNTTEDNAVLQQIAGRLVQHQHTTEPAPQAILISLPEEGSVYTFSRSVQVAENAPLELDLDFASRLRLHFWQIALVLLLLVGLAAAFAFADPETGTVAAESGTTGESE